jgi:putative ABC transport system permease protein
MKMGDRAREKNKRPRVATLIRRDLRGRTFRTVSSVTAVAVIVGALFLTMLLIGGANYSIDLARNRLGSDIIVLPKGSDVSSRPFVTLFYTSTNGYLPPADVSTVGSVSGVKAVTPETYLTMFGFAGGDTGVVAFNYLIAIDPQNNFMLKSWLPANVTQPLANNGTILGSDVPQWDTIPSHGGRFYGVTIHPTFRLASTGTFLDHIVFISTQTAAYMLAWQNLHPNQSDPDFLLPLRFTLGQVSAIFVKLEDGVNPDLEVQKILTADANVDAFTLSDLAHSANVRFAGLLYQFGISGTLVWAGSVLLVSAMTTLGVRERQREFGLLRSIGATRSFVRGLVLSQSVIITAVAGAAGILGAYALFSLFYARVIAQIGVSYITPPLPEILTVVLLAMAATVFTGIVAAWWPARVASRMEPYDALKREKGQ